MNSVFIPIFNTLKTQEERSSFFNFIFFSFFTFLTLLTFFIYFWGADLIVNFFFILNAGEDNERVKDHTSLLIKILFPYILLISLTSIGHGVLNSFQKFTATAWAPVLFNVVIIAGMGLVVLNIIPEKNITVIISLFVLAGGGVNLALALFHLHNSGFKLTIFSSFLKEKIGRFYQLLGPVMLSSGIYQLNVFLVDPIAVSLGVGSVAILFYCTRLVEMPLGIFGVSITTASLPILSKLMKSNQLLEMKKVTLRSLNLVFLLFIPVIIILFFYYPKIISLIFEWGSFKSNETALTSEVFFYYIFSLLAIPLYRILFNLFYALQDTKTPLKATFWSLIVNLTLILVLMIFQKTTSIIAIAFTITSYFLLFFLIFSFPRDLKFNFFQEILKLLMKWSKIIVFPLIIIFFLKKLLEPFWLVVFQNTTRFWSEKLFITIELTIFTSFFLFLYGISLIIIKEEETHRFFFQKKEKGET